MKLTSVVFTVFLTLCSAPEILLSQGGIEPQPKKQECDPAAALPEPPEGNCHHDCGNYCPGFERQENVHPGQCIDGPARCRPKSTPTQLNLYWFDCVVDYSVSCTGGQVACKWQVDSGSAHTAMVIDCEDY